MRVSENWRLKDARYQLKGSRRLNDNEISFPPRAVKPREVQLYQFDKPGEAYVWTSEERLAEVK